MASRKGIGGRGKHGRDVFEDDPELEPSQDQGWILSEDGRRVTSYNLPQLYKKQKTSMESSVATIPQRLGEDDDLASWEPAPLQEADFLLDSRPQVEVNPELPEDNSDKEKRRRYESSDDPMAGWRRLRSLFLAELLRADGLGHDMWKTICHNCECEIDPDFRILRCLSCGLATICGECCLSRHKSLPLHRIEHWNGHFWNKTTLFDEGLCYQLGHGGFACSFPDPKTQILTVMGENTIQSVRVRWCGCDISDKEDRLQVLLRNRWYPATIANPQTVATFESLEMFRVLNVAGNLNVRDYVTSLEILTDGSRSGDVQERYKTLGRMQRQFAFLMRMKRAGRGHEPGGIGATKPGGAAVLCWACPHEGVNLPENWRDADPSLRFLYMLFIAMDANFRMKNRLRKNARSDVPLGPGLGYQVPGHEYRKHLKNYVSEEDISTCLAFAALAQKDTRLATGLRASGVGGCVCTQHETMRPLGLGDLQKGERYANMDFILFSSIMRITLAAIFLTYDIACQYRINLESRNRLLPKKLQHDFEETEIRAALPIWHGDVHWIQCRTKNLVQYQEGAGKTDGEAPERFWGEMNEISYATREMGEGTREDALEDRIDFHNVQKNAKLGETLDKKLRLALVEEVIQKQHFEQVNSTIGDALLKEWSEMYENWYKDRDNNPSPFAPTVKDSVTEAEVRLQLKRDEAEEARTSKTAVSSNSPTGFLGLGLELEETQRRLRAESKAATSTSQEAKLEERRRRFYTQLKGFRRQQEIFMPAGVHALVEEEERRDSEDEPPRAEDIKLWFPSELPDAQIRVAGCRKGLVDMEIKLRQAQCTDALTQLRGRLHAKRHLINYRNTHVTGQRGGMKARGLIDTVGEKVFVHADKYRAARVALVSLLGDAAASSYPELKQEHLTLDEEVLLDAVATKKLGAIGTKLTRGQGRSVQEGKPKNLSWIWTTGVGTDGKDDERVLDAVRLEWSKSRARARRWWEEVRLLQEEMRRVLRFLRWNEKEWCRRAENINDEDILVGHGIKAYALKQAFYSRETATRFEALWTQRAAEV
ncbi:hypothetical protein C8J56DRAFT_1070458 [Mycena floridula]|nr:hypothetical protein C8J56DRAFT_1070458 [Mycena floridula]